MFKFVWRLDFIIGYQVTLAHLPVSINTPYTDPAACPVMIRSTVTAARKCQSSAFVMRAWAGETL